MDYSLSNDPRNLPKGFEIPAISMKNLLCILFCLAAVNSLPKPKPYKESVPPVAGSSYGKYDFKKKFSSLDFEKEPKLEFSESSAALGHTDVGPRDVAAELHAKIEEAAHHALTIIEGAKTFAEEAEKEQVS